MRRNQPLSPVQQLLADGMQALLENLYILAPLNHSTHAHIIKMVDDIGAQLQAPTLEIYAVTKKSGGLTFPVAFLIPNKLLIDLNVFGQLSREEQTAVIAHEIQHSKQNFVGMAAARLLGTQAQRLVEVCAQSAFPGAEQVISVCEQLVEYSVACVAHYEQKADVSAIKVAQAEVYKQAMVKIFSNVVRKQQPSADIDQEQPVEDIAKRLDELLFHRPMNRLLNGGTLSERIHAINVVVQEQERDATTKAQTPAVGL